MRLLALATVTADGRPIVGPVDGIFYRGAFHFGSAPDSVRFRHIRARPQVSATHLPGEELAVTVHGRAVPVDIGSPEQRRLPADAARHLRAALRAAVGGGVPRLRPGLRAHRRRADVHVPHEQVSRNGRVANPDAAGRDPGYGDRTRANSVRAQPCHHKGGSHAPVHSFKSDARRLGGLALLRRGVAGLGAGAGRRDHAAACTAPRHEGAAGRCRGGRRPDGRG